MGSLQKQTLKFGPAKTRTQLLVLIAGNKTRSGSKNKKYLQTELNRIRVFRQGRSHSWVWDRKTRGYISAPGKPPDLPFTALPIPIASLEDAAAAIRKHRPAVVHFRSDGSFPIFGSDLAVDFLDSLSEEHDARVTCVILENCFTFATAETIAERVNAVVGVNGKLVDYFLTEFYARLTIDGPYYEIFESARWQFSNYSIETHQATVEEAPYFVTRDLNCMAAGRAAMRGGVPGHAFAGDIFDKTDPEIQPVAYPLLFGTNRKAVDPNDPTRGYSGERDTETHLGTCTVIVPKSHRIGSLGSPWWKRLLTLTDDRLEINWSTLREYEQKEYYNLIRSELDNSTETEPACVLYIHGFNTSFELAALRAAQLGVDLKVSGVMAFFSWPSKGRFTGYLADEASIDDSEEELTKYLLDLANSVGSGRLHIIAHSMGNRAFLRAMKELLRRAADKTGIRFGQIFLAAPDVDASKFAKLAQAYDSLAARTTLYVSSKDRALASSGILHEFERAGFVPPVTILDGIDTVETSFIDLSFLGHGYFADARSLLQDMHSLLRKDSPPAERFGLRAATYDGRPYWVIS
jgi:esterase/lipase superfamily enzyme